MRIFGWETVSFAEWTYELLTTLIYIIYIYYNYDTVIVKNGTYSLYDIVYVNYGGFVNVQDGEFECSHVVSNNYVYDGRQGELLVNNGTFNIHSEFCYENNGKIHIEDGDFKYDYGFLLYNNEYSSFTPSLTIDNGTYTGRAVYSSVCDFIYENYGVVTVDCEKLTSDYFIRNNYAGGQVTVNCDTMVCGSDIVETNNGELHITDGEYESQRLVGRNGEDRPPRPGSVSDAPKCIVENGTFVCSGVGVSYNNGIIDIHCDTFECGSDFVGENVAAGQVTLNCDNMVCGGDIVDNNVGKVHIIDGHYESVHLVDCVHYQEDAPQDLAGPYVNHYNYSDMEQQFVIDNGSFVCSGFGICENEGLVSVNCETMDFGGDFISTNRGPVSLQCGAMTCEGDVVGDNNNTVEILDGHYEATASICDWNDGIFIIHSGDYTTTGDDAAIIKYNSGSGFLEFYNGTFTSQNDIFYYNNGEIVVHNGTHQANNHLIEENQNTVVFINGEYTSDNQAIVGNNGYVEIYSGHYTTDDNFNSAEGSILIKGTASFDANDDLDRVFYGLENVEVEPPYCFYPAKDAQSHVETRLCSEEEADTIPEEEADIIPVYFYADSALYHTEYVRKNTYLPVLPQLPAPANGYTYLDWVTETGNIYYINNAPVADTMFLYAKRVSDTVQVTFVDGADSTTLPVVKGTVLGSLEPFGISDPAFIGWQDENLLFHTADDNVTCDMNLIALYFHGDTVCTFTELKAAVDAQKPEIMLCDMIDAEDLLRITTNTLLIGMNDSCGLRRIPSYTGDMIDMYDDTANLSIIGLHFDGSDIEGGNAVYFYPDPMGMDSAANRYRYARLNIVNCDFNNFQIGSRQYPSIIWCEMADVNVVSSRFENNGECLYWYQDIYADDLQYSETPVKCSKCIIRDCQFLNNVGSNIIATHPASYDECYLYSSNIDSLLDYSGLEIWDSQISYNTTEEGPIFATRALVALRGNTEVSYNYDNWRAPGVSGYVGALVIVTDNCKLSHNESEWTGGAVHLDESHYIIAGNAEISSNDNGIRCASQAGHSPRSIIQDNARIVGNTYAGVIDTYRWYNTELLAGHIYDNLQEDGDLGYLTRVFVNQPSRPYGTDTLGIRTVFVDELDGRPTPEGLPIPWSGWYQYDDTHPLLGTEIDSLEFIESTVDCRAFWYGLLLNYDANHGTGENVFAYRGVEMNGFIVVDDNMFEYPMHEFLGWNTEADGSGTHYAPDDFLTFEASSKILYAEWCPYSTDTVFINACTEYVWNGETYTESGTYTKFFELEDRCDSLDVLVLTLADEPLQVAITPDSHSACPGVEAVLRAEVTSASDVLAYAWSTSATNDTLIVAPSTTSSYSLTVTDGYGCVGSDTVVITVNPSYNQSESLTICQNELPYTWRDTTFNAGTVTGDYIFNRQTVNGCDSTVTLTLTVNPSYAQSESLTICQNELPYTWRDTTFNAGTTTGDYVFSRQTVNGCDSIVTLTLTVNPSYAQSESLTICQNELPHTWRDTTFSAGTTTGDYVFSRHTVNGCDSTVTLHLTVNPSYAQSENLTVCQNELPYTWRDTTFQTGTTTGDYVFSRQTVNGCDSTVTLTLTVNPSYAQSESLTICQNELPYTWRDTTFNAETTTGDYIFNRQTVNGCDSTVTLTLTVNPSYAQSESLTICQNELPYEWRDTTFQAGTTTGDYVFSRQTVNGCDSVVTLTLTVNPSYAQSESLTICQNELPYTWRDTTFQAGTTTGDYIFSRQTENGCDSTVTLTLTVNPSYAQSESLTICQNELPYTWRDTTFQTETETGDYIFSRQTVNGCDSTVTLHLTVNPSYAQSESLTICQNELPYEWRDTTFSAGTTTGDYVFSRHTVNGCDSIVTLHLTVNPSALEMEDLTDYIRCNGGAFSVTPTGSIPEGTLYTWTVADNANVTGQSAQTTPVAAPISQTLTNNSSSKQTVVYHVTPITDGCEGDEFTVTVDVEPTPELTLNCPADITKTLEFGSCALLLNPEDLGTPTWAHSLGWVLIDITNDAPADNIYPEGDNVITWTMTDECGNTQTCEQHVNVIFPQCPDAVDYEGNVYHGVRIDCDCWTQRNLESNKYSDDTEIPGVYNYVSDVYPDEAENVANFGRLYDWASVIKDGADNEFGHVQGICPEGWYIPTAEKFAELSTYGADALKSPDYWLDGGGSNTTGFTSLPAGYYDGSIDRYMNLMGEAYYWSASKVDDEWTPVPCNIRYICNQVIGADYMEGLGYSVRCIKEKDAETAPEPVFECGTSTIEDIDGNTYNTVKIGDQCWMKENLKTTKKPNGDAIEAGISYPNDNVSNVATYGLLYTWATMMNGATSSEANPSGVQGICPDGWHVPSDAEWTALTTYVSGQTGFQCDGNSDNIAKALASKQFGDESTVDCAAGYDLENNNATGFSALAAGYGGDLDNFFSRSANFWSATNDPTDDSKAYYRYIYNIEPGVTANTYRKECSFSVRCLKD